MTLVLGLKRLRENHTYPYLVTTLCAVTYHRTLGRAGVERNPLRHSHLRFMRRGASEECVPRGAWKRGVCEE